jgi:hypothetical protein
MAWSIEDAVTHGEIDNTIEGHTTGLVWLAGRDEPLILSLDGDCWRDLAGTRLEFENPTPRQIAEMDALDIDQVGLVGDMTASRKNRVPSVSEEEFQKYYEANQEIPYQWRNMLYLEWFSEINGRVVIESANYKLTISPHEWEMDEDTEGAQKLANLNSMRDFMAQVIQRRSPEKNGKHSPKDLDEFQWEERLKETDRLTDAYQEVLEKYIEDIDCEQKEAFVMGWDSLLDALAERDEVGTEDDEEEDDDLYPFSDPELELMEREEGMDYESEADSKSEDGDVHPLQVRAHQLAMQALDVIQQDAGPGSHSRVLVDSLLQVSAKLAGALNDRDQDFEPETGYVLALLKRCLNWLNAAIGASQQLIDAEKDAVKKAAIQQLCSSAFEVRDGIVELRRQLK